MVTMKTDNASDVQCLHGIPVLGQDFANVSMLRLDRSGGPAPGNKAFKLQAVLAEAAAEGVGRVLSFGGAWSNHLHALAACGAQLGMETVGFVRGGEQDTAMLADARRWGMRVVALTRSDYRRRQQPAFQQSLVATHGPGLLVPEGGATVAGVRGCRAIAQRINSAGGHWDRVVVAVGTGTTLAGLAVGLDTNTRLVGISALKNAHDLEQRVGASLASAGLHAQVPWQILHDHHCGGFARVDRRLRNFILAVEAARDLQLEPVYTGKALLAVHDRLASSDWRGDERILVIHTGGLQGRRGYPWLAED